MNNNRAGPKATYRGGGAIIVGYRRNEGCVCSEMSCVEDRRVCWEEGLDGLSEAAIAGN